MKRALMLAVGAAVIIGLTYGAPNLKANVKVRVCHVEGNGGSHVIIVSENAVPAHLAHGDSLNVAEWLRAGDPCDLIDGTEK
jgi:hypothetical protein